MEPGQSQVYQAHLVHAGGLGSGLVHGTRESGQPMGEVDNQESWSKSKCLC